MRMMVRGRNCNVCDFHKDDAVGVECFSLSTLPIMGNVDSANKKPQFFHLGLSYNAYKLCKNVTTGRRTDVRQNNLQTTVL